jgi:hypothetical protein
VFWISGLFDRILLEMVSKKGMPSLLIQDGATMRKDKGMRFMSNHECIDWTDIQLTAAQCRTNQLGALVGPKFPIPVRIGNSFDAWLLVEAK